VHWDVHNVPIGAPNRLALGDQKSLFGPNSTPVPNITHFDDETISQHQPPVLAIIARFRGLGLLYGGKPSGKSVEAEAHEGVQLTCMQSDSLEHVAVYVRGRWLRASLGGHAGRGGVLHSRFGNLRILGICGGGGGGRHSGKIG
jgi:hypothetical protein